MLEKIERIAPVKGADYDVARQFNRKQGYEDHRNGGRNKFASVLQKKLDKGAVQPSNHSPGVPDAYNLELSIRPTQSLFYEQGADLREVRERIDDAG